MGKRGPKPTPTAVNKLRGNPGKRAQNAAEPTPVVEAPECPAWLHKDARAEWDRIVPLLIELGLIARIHLVALAGYCQSYARWQQCEKMIADEGALALYQECVSEAGSVYYQIRPEVTLSQKYYKIMSTFLAEFGLSPATAKSVTAMKSDGKSKAKLLLFGGKGAAGA